MFCSKCGTKLEDNDKFCKKCGQANSQDEKNSKPMPVAQRPPSSCAKGCSWTLLILLLLAFLGFLSIYHGQINNTPTLKIAVYFLTAFFVIIFGWSILHPRKKLVDDTATKKSVSDPPLKHFGQGLMNVLSAIITIAVVLAIAYFVYFFFKDIKINPNNTDDQNNTPITNTGGSAQKATSWDGNYNTTMTKPNCDSPVELTAFQVVDNKVMNLYGNNATIGSDNHASMTMNYSGGMTEKFTFFYSGGKKMLSGTWSSGNCNGRFQGQSTF